MMGSSDVRITDGGAWVPGTGTSYTQNPRSRLQLGQSLPTFCCGVFYFCEPLADRTIGRWVTNLHGLTPFNLDAVRGIRTW